MLLERMCLKHCRIIRYIVSKLIKHAIFFSPSLVRRYNISIPSASYGINMPQTETRATFLHRYYSDRLVHGIVFFNILTMFI